MPDEQKKMDPWQLITILIVLGTVLLGLYLTNLSIDARFDSLENIAASNADALELMAQRIGSKIEKLEEARAEDSAEPQGDAAAQEGNENAASEKEGKVAKKNAKKPAESEPAKPAEKK